MDKDAWDKVVGWVCAVGLVIYFIVSLFGGVL